MQDNMDSDELSTAWVQRKRGQKKQKEGFMALITPGEALAWLGNMEWRNVCKDVLRITSQIIQKEKKKL